MVKLRLHRVHSYTFISGISAIVGRVRASTIGCEQFGQSSKGCFISFSVQVTLERRLRRRPDQDQAQTAAYSDAPS